MNYDYPLDLTGIAPSNLVRNEPQVITEINGRFSQVIIPDYAPFYLDNLKLIHVSIDGTETELQIDTDFFVAYPYQDLARETGKLTFGAIIVVRQGAVNRFKLSYQTIGDKWAADSQHVKNRLLEAVYNPRIAYWDQLTNVQDKFPPQEHNHEITEGDKWPELIAAINRVTKAIAERDYNESSIYPTVINYIENLLPPLLTKAAVGLPDVENLPVASQEDIDGLVSADKYVLLSQLLQVIEKTVDGSVTGSVESITQTLTQLGQELDRVNQLQIQDTIETRQQIQQIEQSMAAMSTNFSTQLQNTSDRLQSVELANNQMLSAVNQASSKVDYLTTRVEALETGGVSPVGSNPRRPTPFMYFMVRS